MHLDGTDSLGIIPINEDNQCVWGCVDIDSYAGFDHKKLIDKIKQFNCLWLCVGQRAEEHTSFSSPKFP